MFNDYIHYQQFQNDALERQELARRQNMARKNKQKRKPNKDRGQSNG